MADYTPPLRDIRFVLDAVLKVKDRWSQWPALAEVVDGETADAILEEAGKLCAQELAPLNRNSDEEGCHWQAGEVTTPQGFRQAYQAFAEGGWVGVGGDPEYGGMGMPKVLTAQVEEMMHASCLAFGLYPMLSAGACLALHAHGSEALKQAYLPNLYSGQWAGSMCLTEPHAGTDLGLIRTRAEPQADGSYRVTGTKIFITAGEHDLTENIIHLVLAKLPDAPAGSRGISLFLVPKILVDEAGALGARNAVACGSLEHKMGIKGAATCVMNFDGAVGYLVGEVNKGLAAMFTMMNYERLGVGIQGLGSSERSYQNALAYARERLQSRSPAGIQQAAKNADPIIVHPDVRRMLLTMKALNEGGRLFSSYVALQLDIAKYSPEPAERERAEALVALLTPVAKGFLTDLGLELCVAGQQVFGGHGYIREWARSSWCATCASPRSTKAPTASRPSTWSAASWPAVAAPSTGPSAKRSMAISPACRRTTNSPRPCARPWISWTARPSGCCRPAPATPMSSAPPRWTTCTCSAMSPMPISGPGLRLPRRSRTRPSPKPSWPPHASISPACCRAP